MFHVPRGKELPLLHIDDSARRGSGEQKICLTAQKRRDLQNIDDLGSRRALIRQMHVTQHRTSHRVLNSLEDTQPLFHADAARGPRRGTVCLIIG